MLSYISLEAVINETASNYRGIMNILKRIVGCTYNHILINLI